MGDVKSCTKLVRGCSPGFARLAGLFCDLRSVCAGRLAFRTNREQPAPVRSVCCDFGLVRGSRSVLPRPGRSWQLSSLTRASRRPPTSKTAGPGGGAAPGFVGGNTPSTVLPVAPYGRHLASFGAAGGELRGVHPNSLEVSASRLPGAGATGRRDRWRSSRRCRRRRWRARRCRGCVPGAFRLRVRGR